MAKQLEAQLNISGELDASLRTAIKSAEERMNELSGAAKSAEGATAALNDTIKRQGQTLRAAQSQYASYVLSGNEASAEARELASGIVALNADLNNNKAALAKAESAAASLASSYNEAGTGADGALNKIRQTGDGANRAGSGFSSLKAAVAGVATAGFGLLVSKAGEALSSLMSLADETREFRQDLSSLNVAYEQANFSADTASDTWKSLYAVFGEDDRAVETANNIARMAQNQGELNNWVKITEGAWATYQDALPVENLAEAAGETAKTGTVTGGLADALNWSSKAAEMFAGYMGDDVVTAEDAFNVALSECSTEQERQALITDTLLQLYGDAGTEYEKNAASLMEANKAAADAQLAQAKLAEIIEPMTTQWTILKTQLMNAVAPALEVVADKLMTAFEWMQKHPQVMKAVGAAVAVLATGLAVLGTVMGVLAIKQAALTAMLLPVAGIGLGIVAAIAAVVAVGVLLYQNWDTIKAKGQELWTFLVMSWDNIKLSVSNAVMSTVATVTSQWNALVGTVQSIWNSICEAVNSAGTRLKNTAKNVASKTVSLFKSYWGSLTSILTSPFDTVLTVIDRVSSKLSSLISKAQNSNISRYLPTFGSGGFTQGLSIAGEAGTEAVISFDKNYRSENLGYWAQAGRMLGVDLDGYSLSGSTVSNATTTVVESVNFSPNITVSGNADRQDIIEAIRATYPEFVDLVDEVLSDRGVGVYA